MNKKIKLDKLTIKFFYSQYKNYIIPVGIIIICLLLIVFAIVPQYQNYRDLKNQEQQELTRLETLKKNLTLLYSLNQGILDHQLKLTSKALPTGKDFIGILNGITIASAKTGVVLGDFSFQVGDIIKPQKVAKSIPSLELSLIVIGDLENLVKFIKELKNTLPLSEVKTINLTSRNSTIKILFYYKALPLVKIKDDLPLTSLSSETLELIADLSGMNNAEIEIIEEALTDTSSTPSSAFSTQ